MPKRAQELGPLAVKRLEKPGLHFVGTVPGLAMQITESGARTWILRIVVGGKRREMGLGGYPAVTLAMAHERARAARETLAKGIDPIELQRETQSALAAAAAKAVTFNHCAAAYVTAMAPEWKNVKHAKQVQSTLLEYASPKMGALLVRDVGLSHVLAVLEPIWRDKTETASRVRGRIEAVLDWATTRGYREGPNPARWRGHLDKLLAKPSKIAKPQHHAALPVGDVGAFMERLRKAEGMGALALQFAILTGARSGEVRGAKLSEIDKRSMVWTVPAERMKAGREHRVPLTQEALDVIEAALALPRVTSDYIFAAPRGGALSDMTLTAVLRRMKIDATVHGFRSTFRDWAAERTHHPNEVVEMALAHTIENKVEAAYRRGDLFEKRRLLMQDWAAFLAQAEQAAEVIPIRRKAR